MTNKTVHIKSEGEMMSVAASLAHAVVAGAIIFLYGPLGAGKTTFARGFLRGLGFEGKVKSPTYTLAEPYDLKCKRVIHFDFYRLEDSKELEHLGVRDYFFGEAVCLIEWPEKGFPYLPEPDLACYISFADAGREIKLESYTARGEAILNAL